MLRTPLLGTVAAEEAEPISRGGSQNNPGSNSILSNTRQAKIGWHKSTLLLLDVLHAINFHLIEAANEKTLPYTELKHQRNPRWQQAKVLERHALRVSGRFGNMNTNLRPRGHLDQYAQSNATVNGELSSYASGFSQD